MVHRLLEDLVPFLDHDIFDPLSAQLGGQLKRKQRVDPSANKVCLAWVAPGPPKLLSKQKVIQGHHCN